MTATADLSDAEFAALDELLMQAPQPLQPLDAVMLDGFLCGVTVQPRLLEPSDWLPFVYHFEGSVALDDVAADWRAKCEPLILRRQAALNRSLHEDGWFDPLVLEPDDENEGVPAAGAPGSGPEGEAAAGNAPAADDDLEGLSPVSRPLMPWVAGFQYACACFPELSELADDDVMAALSRVYRHLPAETDEEREIVETLDREQPLADLDEAIEDLVNAVADLADLTQDERYRVETVRRDAPKVGRNDPCPCGSGRKYKQCHGAG
jgi:uncharacterized protein